VHHNLVDALQYLPSLGLISLVRFSKFVYMHSPREPHLTAVRRIMCYLQGTLDHGLLLQRSSALDLIV
jgi:hypothetical protein